MNKLGEHIRMKVMLFVVILPAAYIISLFGMKSAAFDDVHPCEEKVAEQIDVWQPIDNRLLWAING